MHPTYAFKIVLLHEDLVSGLRGSSVVERLAGQLEMDARELETDIWKFAVLRDSELRAQVLNLLLSANMIIISAAGEADLPAHIREVIETALQQRDNREAAIVALFDWAKATCADLPRAGRYLQQLAVKTGLDFFCNKGEWQPETENFDDPPRSCVHNPWPPSERAVSWNS